MPAQIGPGVEEKLLELWSLQISMTHYTVLFKIMLYEQLGLAKIHVNISVEYSIFNLIRVA